MPEKHFMYWGKKKWSADEPGDDYHLLTYHSIDVAAVGYCLLDPKQTLCRSIARLLEIRPEVLQAIFTFALSVHDLGKFLSAFQALYSHGSSQLIKASSRFGYCGKSYRHDRLGLMAWMDLQNQQGLDFYQAKGIQGSLQRKVNRTFEIFLNCTFGHHGNMKCSP